MDRCRASPAWTEHPIQRPRSKMAPIVCLVFCLFGSFLSTTWAEGLQPEPEAKARCPSGTFTYREGVRWYCFELFEDPLSFEEAEAVCQQLGNDGYLASLTNEAQTRLVGGYVTQANLDGSYVWIGLRRNRNSNYVNGWRWTDGARFKYTKWQSGKPINNASRDYCVALFPTTGYKDWFDAPCDEKKAFLCRWRPS